MEDNIYDNIKTYKDFNAKTIQDWVVAQQWATKSYLNPLPRKQPLIDVFDKVMLDPHLTAVLQQRTSKVLGEEFEIVKNGEVDTDLTKLVNKNWLQEFFLGAMHSRYYGYTLYEIDEIDTNGEITGLREINRRNVIPEARKVLKDTWSTANTFEIDAEEYADYLYLLTDNTNELGLLNKAVPSVMRKLYAQTSWLQHAQVAGLPLIFGKMQDPTPTAVAELITQLALMARNGVGVAGAGDSVQVIDRNGAGHGIYQAIVELENSEITKLILSQTATTEANSSYAQSKTHKSVADELSEEDKTYCTNAFNNFIPQLIRLGYPLTDCVGRFKKDTSANPEQVTMLMELLKFYDIDEEEILKITGIPVQAKLTKNKPLE